MPYLFRALMIIMAFGIVAVNGQVSTEFRSLDEVAEASDYILTGEAVSNYPVVRKDKFDVIGAGGKYSLPRESDYLLGEETVIKVISWVKGDKETNKLQTIRVFVPGLNVETPVYMLRGKLCLLFLKKIKLDSDDFKTAFVMRLVGNRDASENIFNGSEYFSVVGLHQGVVKDEKKISDFLRKYRQN